MKRTREDFGKIALVGWFVFVAFVHGNAILKNEDPLRDGQTEGILYDQKMEQEKDGVKAAATPKVIYYGGQGFLTKSSLSKNEKESESGAAKKKKQTFNWSDWWEEKPAEPDLSEVPVVETPLIEETVSADAVSVDSEVLEPDIKDDFWTDSESEVLAPEVADTAVRGDDWW